MSIIANGNIVTEISGQAPFKIDFATDVQLTLPPEVIGVQDLGPCDGYSYGKDFQWDFGDGIKGQGAEVSHVYLLPGIYITTVTYVFDEFNIWYQEGGSSGAWGWYCGGPSTITEQITVIVTEKIKLYTLEKCYRLGMGTTVQGHGPSEYTGENWPFPTPGLGGKECVDELNQVHEVLYDCVSGTFREIAMVDGATGTSETKKFTDDDYLGEGHEIDGSIELQEVNGGAENFLIEHEDTFLFHRPENEANKNQTGYDANGFRTAQSIDVQLIMDGDTTLPLETDNIPAKAEIEFDKRKEMHRGRMKIIYAASEIIFTGIRQYFIAKDKGASLTQRVMVENGYQDEIQANRVWWLSRDPNPYRERISGNNISSAFMASLSMGTTGPDGNAYSALTVAHSPLMLPSFVLQSGMIMFWANSDELELSVNDDDVTLTILPISGSSWKLCYSRGIVKTGIIKINLFCGSEFAIFDISVYGGTSLSDDAIAYYFNDVVNNNGNNCLPLF